MSDDEADPELLELLRQSLAISPGNRDELSSDTGVLKDAEFIYNNAIDVSINMYGAKNAATLIHRSMQERSYSTEAWSQHELHPKTSEGFSDVDIANFIFTMDLLNFSFWSELPETQRYQVEYRGKRWTGYWGMVACLRRALEESTPITTPRFWRSEQASDEVLRNVFRGATDETMPLLSERIAVMKEVADVLYDSFSDPDDQAEDQVRSIEQSAGLLSEPDTDAERQATTTPVDSPNVEPTAEPFETEPAVHDSVDDWIGSSIDEDASTETAPSMSDEPAVPRLAMRTEGSSDVPAPASNAPRSPEELRIPSAALQQPDKSVVRLIEKADHSAGKLVNLLGKHFPCFRDEAHFDGKKVRLLKRAQIFVADLWAAFNGKIYGEFLDVDILTMFADYRVPQMLHSLGVLSYSPPLEYRIRDLKELPSGHSWEVQLRGCSIWAVELIRREILAQQPEAEVNAVLIDFFLYDAAKELEGVQGGLAVPHHRTRSIWY